MYKTHRPNMKHGLNQCNVKFKNAGNIQQIFCLYLKYSFERYRCQLKMCSVWDTQFSFERCGVFQRNSTCSKYQVFPAKNMEFLLTYSMLFCRQLQCLNKYFFDKSFWKGSALQVRCSFQAVKLRYKPLQYSCQKVVCFWQCKLVNNQHSFQKSTNSYCSWKVVFAFKTSFPEVLAPLQKTKNIKQIIRKVLQESWLSLGFNKTLNIPETSRNTLFQKSWDWGSRRSRQKTTFPKVSRFAEKSQNESAFQEVLLLGGVGGGQQRVSEYCFLFQSVSPISIVVGGQKSCLRILLFFNVVLEAHIHEQM